MIFQRAGVVIVFIRSIEIERIIRNDRQQIPGGSVHRAGGGIEEIEFGIAEGEGDRIVRFRRISRAVMFGITDQNRVVNTVGKATPCAGHDLNPDNRFILERYGIVGAIEIGTGYRSTRVFVFNSVVDIVAIVGIVRFRPGIVAALFGRTADARHDRFFTVKHSGGKGQSYITVIVLVLILGLDILA